MVVLVDSNRAVEISIREWNEENPGYGPDWSADFYEVGNLRKIPDLSDCTDADLAEMGLPARSEIHVADVLDEHGDLVDGLFGADFGYVAEDVDYAIDQANDMVKGEGDFAEAGAQPNQTVDVTELDRSAYPKL